MINKLIDVFLYSFFVTIVIGMMVNRLFPSWEGLVAEVGTSGAWIASLFVHFIYGLAVSAGATLSQILSKNVIVSRNFWIIASGVIVALLHLFLLFVQYEFAFYVFLSLLTGICFILFLLALAVWKTSRLN